MLWRVKMVEDVFEKGVGGKEHHIISLLCCDKGLNVGGDFPVFALTPSRVFTRDVVGDYDFALACLKR